MRFVEMAVAHAINTVHLFFRMFLLKDSPNVFFTWLLVLPIVFSQKYFNINAFSSRFKSPSKITFDGFTYHFESYFQIYHVLAALKERQYLLSLDAKDRIALDIGASIGCHSNYFSRNITVSKTIAFEPASDNYGVLVANSNNKSKAFECEKIALTSTNGKAWLSMAGWGAGQHSLARKLTCKGASGEEVNCHSLDSYLESHGHSLSGVGIMKIDVEGNELDVMKGAMKTITASRPIIMFESEQESFNAICVFLLDYGYTVAKMNYLNYVAFPKGSSRNFRNSRNFVI